MSSVGLMSPFFVTYILYKSLAIKDTYFIISLQVNNLQMGKHLLLDFKNDKCDDLEEGKRVLCSLKCQPLSGPARDS